MSLNSGQTPSYTMSHSITLSKLDSLSIFPHLVVPTLVYNSVIKPLSDKYVKVENPIASKIQETAEGVSTGVHY